MTTFGLTTTGFVPKTVDDLDTEIAAAQRAAPALGADWKTDAESPNGQLNGVMSARFAELWELAALVYRSRDPRNASFAGLDAVTSLTGTTRTAATKGTVTLSVTLNAGVTLAAGSVARVAGQPTNRWVTTASVTNSGGSPATLTVAAEAESAGPFAANATTITEIATPVTGWTAVSNAADAQSGHAAERDPALRSRRERELAAGGTSPVDAVHAALSRVAGVSVVAVAENDSNTTDPTLGLPPHSLWAVVQGGTDAAVASALWKAKAGGIELFAATVGTLVTQTIVDASGASRAVYFTRPSDVNAYATVTVVYDDGRYAGDAAVQAAVAAVTAGQGAGATLRKSDIIAAARAVAGVIDCTAVLLGRSSGSVADMNLIAFPWEVLKLATGRITAARGYV